MSEAEKEEYTVDDSKTETYEGYKPRQAWVRPISVTLIFVRSPR